MISFIVIGKNEEKNIKKCFDSIINYIKFNNIISYELIYVDSNSSDETVDIVKSFSQIKIFKIVQHCNAAIARNIGANEGNGDIFFFIDGDMEIDTHFLPLCISENKLIYPFISGVLINSFHDDNNAVIKEIYFGHNSNSDTYSHRAAGIFLITASLWNEMKGMNDKYARGEDLDLGLRLAAKGIKILRKKEVIAIHNTFNRTNLNYLWKYIIDWNNVYSRAVLYRNHLFNIYCYQQIIKSDPTFAFLIISIFFSLLTWNYFFIGIYIAFLVYISIKLNRNSISRIINRFFYQISRDIQNLIAFLFFYPRNQKTPYKYINIT
jgi:glycosyltransferase involved in cell wall biosynthesis